MPDTTSKIRDGISQQMRRKAALLPEYAKIDERSLRDDLEFILKCSKELRYFNEDDKPAGDLSELFSFFPQGDDVEQKRLLDNIEYFIKNIEALPEDQARAYQQPHFVLLLSFLKLLEVVRERLNGLTKKHLDFYFQDVLRMQKKKAVPDRVHVLVDLAKNTKEFLLPAGTLLNAGKDSAGRMLIYKTDEDAYLNHVQVAKVKSVYLNKRIVDIQLALNAVTSEEDLGNIFQDDIAEFKKIEEKVKEKCSSESFLKLFEIIFGGQFYTKDSDNYVRHIDFEKIFYQLKFIKTNKEENGLGLSFNEFYKLIELKKRLEGNEDFNKINKFLFNGEYTDKNFNKNFESFFGYHPFDDKQFNRISDDVLNIIDFYLLLEREGHEKYKEKFNELIKNQSWENFKNAIKIKIDIDNAWKKLDEILNIQSLESNQHVSFKEKFNYTYKEINPDHLSEKKYLSIMKVDKIEDLYDEIKKNEDIFSITSYHLYLLLSACISNKKEIIDRPDIIKISIATYQKIYKKIINNYKNIFINYFNEYITDEERNLLRNSDIEKTRSILIRAGRNREGNLFGLVPTKEEWQGVYAIDDAASAIVKGGDTPRWKTFGQFNDQDKDTHQTAEFGLAISSPVLLLSQGDRTITLTFNSLDTDNNDRLISFLNENNVKLSDIFCISISKENGWITNKKEEIEYNKIKISIPVDSDKISAPKFGYFKNIKWPVLKIIFKQNLTFNVFYQKIKNIFLSNINIAIEVRDVGDFIVKNDLQLIDSKKPFEPFGAKPMVGSRCYISHPDLFNKKINSIIFKIDWANIEQLTDEYYSCYNKYRGEKKILGEQFIEKKDSFKISIEYPLLPEAKRTKGLFFKESGIYKIKLDKDDIESSFWNIVEPICWKLQQPDFQHSIYPMVAAEKSIEMAAAIANKKERETIKKDDYIVNQPYTPVISKMTIDYNAFADLNENNIETKLFHIYPFGYAEVQPVRDDSGVRKKYPFLPKLDNAGELYIGLENFKPSQQSQRLNMLFQLAEGSANADLTPETVHWDYLSGNQWRSLEDGGILSDGTQGLMNTGIIQFSLPASHPSTLLPPELYWLRARIIRHPDSVCDIVDIHTQAVSATLIDQDNAAGHFQQTLAKETIKKLVNPIPAVKGIRQPYTSFAGKGAEPDELFCTRVSERLRHKQRALTIWDYEHLVLEYFPQIYKAKCIPASSLEDNDNLGAVELIVIPDISNRMPSDPFEPKASVQLLSDVQKYLRRFAPDSANIIVKNAEYVPFEISMAVRFVEKCDEGYGKKRLNEELNRFLAPWAYAEKNSEIVIGQTIYASSIINFVERLDYVDYVAHIKFFSLNKDDTKKKVEIDELKITTTEEAVVLVPVNKHIFNVIPRDGYSQKIFTGINYMKIGLDFEIA